MLKQFVTLSLTALSLTTSGLLAYSAEPVAATPACPAATSHKEAKCPGSCPDSHQGGHNTGEQQEADHMALLSRLGLSEEQSTKVKAIMEQGRMESQVLYQQLKEKRDALMSYLKTDDAIESKALTMNEDIQTLRGRLGEMRLKTWFAIREHLTPEQRHNLQHAEKTGH